MKVLIDTNVVLDFALERVPFQDEAKKIFKAIDEHHVTGYLIASAVTDIYYFISKAYGNEPASAFISHLVGITQIIAVDKELIQNSLQLGWSDFEDSLQFLGGKSVSSVAIITRNPKDFKASDIPVFTPSQFLEQLPNS